MTRRCGAASAQIAETVCERDVSLAAQRFEDAGDLRDLAAIEPSARHAEADVARDARHRFAVAEAQKEPLPRARLALDVAHRVVAAELRARSRRCDRIAESAEL